MTFYTQSAGVHKRLHFFPTFGRHFFVMSEGLDHRISKYGVLGATKKNFSLLRGVEPTSTLTYFFTRTTEKFSVVAFPDLKSSPLNLGQGSH